MITYLVTGGAGFIGSTLVRILRNNGCSVVVLDALTYSGRTENLNGLGDCSKFEFVEGDIRDSHLVASLLEKFRPTAVINLAAESHVDRSIDSSQIFVQSNIVGVHALLESSLAYWRSLSTADNEQFRFLQVSTDEVYGSVKSGEADEGTVFDPSSPYSASKASADMLTRSFFHTYRLPVLITHGCNTYGPRQYPEKLIPLMILRALSNKPLPVYGDGSNVREWLHVEDHALGILKTLKKGVPGYAYNLGSRYRLSNLEVTSALCEILGDMIPSGGQNDYLDLIQFVEDRPGHDLRYAMDSSRAKSHLDWETTVEFREGLVSTVEWYTHNRQWWTPITGEDYPLVRLGQEKEIT